MVAMGPGAGCLNASYLGVSPLMNIVAMFALVIVGGVLEVSRDDG